MKTFTDWNDISDDFEGHCYVKQYRAEYWLIKGRIIQRDNGPACICDNGSEWWCVNGKCHRLDGPAHIDLVGTPHYYLNDQIYGKEYYFAHPLVIKHKLESILKLGNIT